MGMQAAEWPMGGSRHARAVPPQDAAQYGLRRRADSGREVALRGHGLLWAEISPGVTRGKHLGRCGRSLKGRGV